MTSVWIKRHPILCFYSWRFYLGKMDRLTIGERVEIIKFYYDNGNSTVSTFGALLACDLTPSSMRLCGRLCLREQCSKFWAMENQYLWSYGWDITEMCQKITSEELRPVRGSEEDIWRILCFMYNGEVQSKYWIKKTLFHLNIICIFFSLTLPSVLLCIILKYECNALEIHLDPIYKWKWPNIGTEKNYDQELKPPLLCSEHNSLPKLAKRDLTRMNLVFQFIQSLLLRSFKKFQ